MKRLPLFAALLLLPLLAFHPSSSSISYETSYRDAVKQARKEKKLIFMVVCVDGCTHCNRYKNNVLNNMAVSQYVNDKFIPIYVDPSKGMNAYRLTNWGISKVPTTLIMSPDRKYKKIRTGYQTQEQLLKAGDEAYTEFASNLTGKQAIR